MALRNPALWLSGRTDHAAVDYRMMLASLVRLPGAMTPGAMLVAPTGTPSMAVQVAAGSYTVAASGANQGFYHVYNDAPVTLAIATAPAAGQTRQDYIILRVVDNGTGTSQAQLEVVTGTPATTGSQVPPPVPAGNLAYLGFVVVTGGSASIGSGSVGDNRRQAQLTGGIRFCLESQRGAAPAFDGEQAYCTDSDKLYLGAGGVWRWMPTEDETGRGQVAFVSAASGTSTPANGALTNTGLQTTVTFKAGRRYRVRAVVGIVPGTAASLARAGVSGVTLITGGPAAWQSVVAGQNCRVDIDGYYEPGASDVTATLAVTVQASSASTTATAVGGQWLSVDDVRKV